MMVRATRLIAILVLLTVVALAVVGCGGGGIPDDVKWSVIQDDAFPQFAKRQVKVQLNRKVSEDTLDAIAQDVKDDDSDYERIFIAYYVLGMDVNQAAWATTNFAPDLRVIVNGLTVEQEEQFLAEPIPEGREVVGRWISDQAASLSGLITIYEEDGKTFVERRLADGGTLTLEAVEVPSASGRRFNLDLGEYVVLDDSEEFRYHLKDGRVFERAKKVR